MCFESKCQKTIFYSRVSVGMRFPGVFFYVFLYVFRTWEADFVSILRICLQMAFIRTRVGKQILPLFMVIWRLGSRS